MREIRMVCVCCAVIFMACILLPKIAVAATVTVADRSVSVPFICDIRRHLIVRATLNKTQTGYFAIDTGSDVCVVSDRMIRLLGYKNRAGEFVLPSIQLGNIEAKNTMAKASPDRPLETFSGIKVDGIIGMNVLTYHALLIDFQKHEIVFWNGGCVSSQERKAVGMEKAYSTPLLIEPAQPASLVSVLVGKTKQKAIIDTGSEDLMLPKSLAQKLGIKPLLPPEANAALIDGTVLSLSKGYIPSFSVAGWTWKNPVVSFLSNGLSLPIVLGQNFLMQHRVLLDYRQHVMYLQPLSQRITTVKLTNRPEDLPQIDVMLNNKTYHFGIGLDYPTCLDQGSLSASPVPDIGTFFPCSLRVNEKLVYERSFVEVTTLERLRSPFSSLDGFLGMQICPEFALRFDFSGQQMDIISPGYVADTPVVSDKAKRIPMIKMGVGYEVVVNVNGVPAVFAVDLGEEHTTLCSKSLAGKLHPAASLECRNTERAMRVLQLDKIEVAGFVWKQPIVVEDTDLGALNPNVLGMDFLRRFRLVVDLPGQALYLEPDPLYKEDTSGQRGTGLVLRKSGTGKITVKGVYAPSPAAEAGIQAGDVLLAINGQPVQAISMEDMAEFWQAPLGTTIKLQVQRKGENTPREFTLTVRKLL